jgi:hypothetical protein
MPVGNDKLKTDFPSHQVMIADDIVVIDDNTAIQMT